MPGLTVELDDGRPVEDLVDQGLREDTLDRGYVGPPGDPEMLWQKIDEGRS